jgi:hypothetical protein
MKIDIPTNMLILFLPSKFRNIINWNNDFNLSQFCDSVILAKVIKEKVIKISTNSPRASRLLYLGHINAWC